MPLSTKSFKHSRRSVTPITLACLIRFGELRLSAKRFVSASSMKSIENSIYLSKIKQTVKNKTYSAETLIVVRLHGNKWWF
jgi:hypothetical protein